MCLIYDYSKTPNLSRRVTFEKLDFWDPISKGARFFLWRKCEIYSEYFSRDWKKRKLKSAA